MPTYDFTCDCGKEVEIYLPVDQRDDPQFCECGKKLKRKLALPQPAIFKASSNQMTLDALNSGISCLPRHRTKMEAGAMAGIKSTKRVIGKGMSFKKRGK